MPYVTETEYSSSSIQRKLLEQEKYIDWSNNRIEELEKEIAALTTRLQEAEAVIKPFANDDFCVELSGNFQGDLPPVFQRVQAMLTLGDFRRAAAWLKGGTN